MITRRATIITGSALALTPTTAWACPPTFRIIVSLADNEHQGIVPVSDKLGNGQDPENNLYWGAMYGIKSYLGRHENWSVNPNKYLLKNSKHIIDALNCSFKNRDKGYAMGYAEAWDGAYQKQATQRFMDLLLMPEDSLTIFVGHNPLMDIDVEFPRFAKKHIQQNLNRDKKFAVIGCQSRKYFENGIKATGHEPYVLTNGNMAPEAYVVEAIIRAWAEGKPAQTAREYAAKAYAKYQKIPLKNANWLFGV